MFVSVLFIVKNCITMYLSSGLGQQVIHQICKREVAGIINPPVRHYFSVTKLMISDIEYSGL